MENNISIRDRLLEVIKEQMTLPSFEAFAKPLEIHKIDRELAIAYLAIPQIPGKNITQIVSILQNRYLKLLEDSLETIMRERYRIVIKELSDYEDMAIKTESTKKQDISELKKQDNFMEQCTFDSFVVGESNRFAHAAALAVAEYPSDAYNPLYIYAAPGLGKTHILHAIGNHLIKTRPELEITYVSAESFTTELVNSIMKNETFKFKQKYRNVDVLLIDDIQFFGKTAASQEEFFHTFNALYQAKKQIVISSDCEPEKLDNLEERLRSRFAWNMIAEIQPPDYETRVAILAKLAELRKIEITIEVREVIDLIASSVKNNVRELEGAFNRIVNYAKLMNDDINITFAKKVLRQLVKEKEEQITPQKIKRVVAEFYQVQEMELDSDKRQKKIAEARQVAMYLTRELTNLSLPAIGDSFGGKHHTTVLHACKNIEKIKDKNSEMKRIIDELREDIEL